MKNMEYLCYKSEKNSMIYNKVSLQLYENNMHRKKKAKEKIYKIFKKFVLGGSLWVNLFSFFSLNYYRKPECYSHNTQNAYTTSFKSQQNKIQYTNI